MQRRSGWSCNLYHCCLLFPELHRSEQDYRLPCCSWRLLHRTVPEAVRHRCSASRRTWRFLPGFLHLQKSPYSRMRSCRGLPSCYRRRYRLTVQAESSHRFHKWYPDSYVRLRWLQSCGFWKLLLHVWNPWWRTQGSSDPRLTVF